MPISHFDLLKGDKLIKDEFGQDLPDIEAARTESIESAREQIADSAKQGIDATNRVFLIRDAAGETLVTLPFSDILKPS